MIPLDHIKPGQKWAFAKVNRGDIEISWVNASTQTVYWFYADYQSNIFDSPYEQFLKDFKPRDQELLGEQKGGPNEDRDFLL